MAPNPGTDPAQGATSNTRTSRMTVLVLVLAGNILLATLFSLVALASD